MKNNIILYASIFTLILGFSACGHDKTADEEAAFELSADEIVAAYLDDEEAANAKFNDHIVQITGPIMEMNKEGGKVVGIKISSDEFNIVNGTFQDPVAPEAFNGETATIKGVCSGFLGDATSMLPGGTVELKRASLVNEQ